MRSLTRVRRIYQKEFRALCRELHEEFRAIDSKVTVYYRPISWPAVRDGLRGRYDSINGYYEKAHHRAIVTVWGRVTRWKILFTMAHELRHAQHRHYGIFKDYYEENPKDCEVGFRAEKNCDRWAIRWLNSHGIKVEPSPKHFYYDYSTFKYMFQAMVVQEDDKKKKNLTTTRQETQYFERKST